MIKRLYIDNFRCLVNFDLALDDIALFVGANGSGKSSVFDAIAKLQAFLLDDARTADVFSGDDLTSWQTSGAQTFVLRMAEGQSTFEYELVVEHDDAKRAARVRRERLQVDGAAAFLVEQGEALVFSAAGELESKYPYPPTQSLLSLLQQYEPDQRFFDFLAAVRRIIVLRLNPAAMSAESEAEDQRLAADGSNFASWYRYLSQFHQPETFKLTERLQEIIDGFESFSFEAVGRERRLLHARISNEDDNRLGEGYRFDQLSDGQRALAILYSVVDLAAGRDYVLCIDEPENFVALPEIQPWLRQVFDMCSEGPTQAILASHHPELLNYLGASCGVWLERSAERPVRVRRITEDDTGLPISELVARGWIGE